VSGLSEEQLIERVRSVCLALPEATERPSHGAPSFFVKRQFLAVWARGHHEDQFPHLWAAAPPGAQEASLSRDSHRFFRPPYVGGRGWIGMRLDGDLDWGEVEDVCVEAYRAVAPARLVALLDGA
jgi:hypothetical protein